MDETRRPALIEMLLVVLIVAGTTAHAQERTFADIEGFTWVLRDIGASHVPLPALPLLAVFLDGTVSGSAGCNDYRAGYTGRDATEFEIDSIYTTRRACEPLVMAQEDAFLAKLQGVNRFEFVDGDLVLDYWLDWMDGHYGTMRFERHTVPDSLYGAPWSWVRYEDPVVGGVDIFNPEAFSLAFADHGRLTLATDCLEATLPYAVDGANVTINTRGLDLSGCTADSPSLRLVRDLEFVGYFDSIDDRLLLGLFADSGALLFERAR